MEEEKIQNNEAFQEQIIEASGKIKEVIIEVHKKVVGQEILIRNLIIGLLGKGHILLEGVPGLAKTLTVKTLSEAINLGFNRVQFTPDLLPSDLIGTEIYNVKTGEFNIKKGPIFNNFILADEINRAPSKVQSALLEAMAEKHITIGNDTFFLEDPFIVLATQNPIEQSGTYKLPEAQLDRFMMKTIVKYPSLEEEKEMYKKLNSSDNSLKVKKVLTKKDIFSLQKIVENIFVSENIYEYVTNIIDTSRNPSKYSLNKLEKYINYGISPRGGLALISGAKVLAMIKQRSFVIPEDIIELAYETLAHRIVLSYEAIANDIDENYIIKTIIENTKMV